MGLASAALFGGAALLPWMSLVTVAVVGGLAFPVFGGQATLWVLAGPTSPIAVTAWAPLAAGLIVVVAAVAGLFRGSLGGILGAVALVAFLGGTWSVLGIHAVGSALTVAAIGPGVEWAAAGVVTGAAAYRFRARSLPDLIRTLRTRSALERMGLFLAVVFLCIDAADHATGGQWLAVLGDGPVEPYLHALFAGAVASIGLAYVLRHAWFTGKAGASLIGIAAGGVFLDGLYHVLTGDSTELIGHTAAEAIAHLATYYGIALLVVSRFVLAPE